MTDFNFFLLLANIYIARSLSSPVVTAVTGFVWLCMAVFAKWGA